MKYINCWFLFFCISISVQAQISIYSESFDNVQAPILPSGWSASGFSGVGWRVDSTNSSGYAGASGMNNVVIRNNENTSGDFELISPTINASEYYNLQINFGSRVSSNFLVSGSTLPTLYYSIDGGLSWMALSYEDNDANSLWGWVNLGTSISLPNNANNQPLLRFKWVIHIEGDGSTTSGTYRLDDFSLSSSSTSSVLDNPIPAWDINFVNDEIRTNTDEFLLLTAYALDGRKLEVKQLSKNHWTLQNESTGLIVINISDKNQKRNVSLKWMKQ